MRVLNAIGAITLAVVFMIAATTTPKSVKAATNDDTFTVYEIEGTAGLSIPVRVAVPQNIQPRPAFVTFDGFTDDVMFSHGKRLADSWLVPANEIAQLTVKAPVDKPQLFLMEVTLTAEDSSPIETQLIRVDIRQPPRVEIPKSTLASLLSKFWTAGSTTSAPMALGGPSAPPPTGNTTPPNIPQAAPKNSDTQSTQAPVEATDGPPEVITTPADNAKPADNKMALITPSKSATIDAKPEVKKQAPARTLSQQNPEAVKRLFDKAGALLASGDISAARLIFEHLASLGHAQSAFELAQTYEADVLRKYRIVATSGDRKQAAAWYRRAARLGSPQAKAIVKAARSE